MATHNFAKVGRSKEITADLDLGAKGATLGDREFFGAQFTNLDVTPHSPLGYEIGVCELVAHADPATGRGQLWQCVANHKWKAGDFTVQFVQDFTEPYTHADPWRFAITGGTNQYKGARGEVKYAGDKDIRFNFQSIP